MRRVWVGLMWTLVVAAVAYCGGRWLSHRPVQDAALRIDHVSVLNRIRALDRLESTAFYFETIIRTQRQGNWYALWQDGHKGLFIAHGHVVAGVDLARLQPKDVQEVDGRIIINLPAPTVLSVQLRSIEAYDWRSGALNLKPVDALVFNTVQLEAKRQLLHQACENGILQQAQTRSQAQIERLFSLVKQPISVYTRTAERCAVLA